jgi:hypothetical protein
MGFFFNIHQLKSCEFEISVSMVFIKNLFKKYRNASSAMTLDTVGPFPTMGNLQKISTGNGHATKFF